MMYIICILCVGVCLLHVIHVGKEDTFLQAYVASNLGTGQKVWGGGLGRSREGVGHEVLSLVQGVGRAICSYP